MIVFSLAFYYFLNNDQQLDAIEGAVLFLSLLLFIAYSLKYSEGIEEDDSMDALTMTSNFKISNMVNHWRRMPCTLVPNGWLTALL